ncbi:MAG TPA: peptidoglycan DD-metalloendopeptidase family protein [Rhodanobacter sp.]|nr:peptidoglycan DD-metalloendopeptidase family protein [Rhodanobacter sp.]
MLACMDHSVRFLCLIVLSAGLAGCGSLRSTVSVEPATGSGSPAGRMRSAVPARTPIPGGSYVVVKGDTLYSIAFRKGVDFRDLATWNGVSAPYTIWPGQRLILSPAHSATPGRRSAAPAVAPVFEPLVAEPSKTSTALPRVATTPAPAPVHAPTLTPAPMSQAAPAAGAAVEAVPVAGMPVTPAPSVVAAPRPSAAGASRSIGGVNWSWPVAGTVIGRFSGSDAIPGIEIAGHAGDPVRAAADGVVVYSGNGLVGYGELVIIKHNDSFLSAYGHNRKRLVKEGERVTAGQQIAEMGSTGATRNELEFQIRKNGNPVDPLTYLPPR